MRRLLLALVFAVSFVTPARPQDGLGTPKQPAVAGTDDKSVPGEVDVHFLNGSTVRMLLHSKVIEVETLYGKLTIPAKDVRAIDFGLHLPDGTATQIAGAVKDLGAGDYASRDRAGRTLLKLGPYSYLAVHRAARAGDLETSRRAKEILKQLKAKHPRTDLKLSPDDRIVTAAFTINGRILTTSLQGQSELFAQADFAVAKMRSLRTAAGLNDELEVNLDAAKYAAPGQWLETNFDVESRTLLVISATGNVELDPQNIGQTCGPNGLAADPNFGGRGPAFMLLGDRRIKGSFKGIRYAGMLLGRIGEEGEPFIIGERYEGVPEDDGKLYLHIAPGIERGGASSGSYDVKMMRRN